MAVLEKQDRSNHLACTWTARETEVLIYVWGDHFSDLRRVKHNRHVYEKIREEMETEHGISRTFFEVKNKIDNLTKFYRKVKKQSLNISQSEWKFFAPIDAILGSLAGQEDDDTQDISPTASACDDENMGNSTFESMPSEDRTPGRRRRNRFAEDVLATIQSMLQQRTQVEDDFRKNNVAVLKLLERQTELQEKTLEVSEQMVTLLSMLLQK